jgi:selenocysteine-specific elongation factor
MVRVLILGAAGHIDHGRALTGVECDRLPEGKARGVAIDFAHLTPSPCP